MKSEDMKGTHLKMNAQKPCPEHNRQITKRDKIPCAKGKLENSGDLIDEEEQMKKASNTETLISENLNGLGENT